ncbi:hypothetical protein GCM10010191_15780 [Actinomadura vinacea]|uniref:Uncharacterized protein n=1 Tax=Actinomadura vinacea TaxID=115336 RepID=A0ABP5VRY3_9ACTN
MRRRPLRATVGRALTAAPGPAQPGPRTGRALRPAVPRPGGTIHILAARPRTPRLGSLRLGRTGPRDARTLGPLGPAASPLGRAGPRDAPARRLVPVSRAGLGSGRPGVHRPSTALLGRATARLGPGARTAGGLSAFFLWAASAGFVPVHGGAG